MNLDDPLTIDQIDFRIQSINKGGYATILAYKDARVDMNRLNQVYGAGRWQRKHELINGNLFCSVGVWNEDIKEWCWVQDVGTESNTEKQKGQASDSFKRACFNLGIGIELYDYPLIQVKLNQDEFKVEGNKAKATWNLKLKEWGWSSQFTDGKLTVLTAHDEKGNKRFEYNVLISSYTKEQKATFDMLISNKDSLGYIVFVKSISEDAYNALYNSFPDGMKVKGKEQCQTLEKKGFVVKETYSFKLTEYARNGDKEGIAELSTELEEAEKAYIFKFLDSETRKSIKELMQG